MSKLARERVIASGAFEAAMALLDQDQIPTPEECSFVVMLLDSISGEGIERSDDRLLKLAARVGTLSAVEPLTGLKASIVNLVDRVNGGGGEDR